MSELIAPPPSMPVGVCVKVASLRPRYDNLAEYLADERNVLVCRRGRIWISQGSGMRSIFHWPDSPFCNPFKVSDQLSLSECLARYRLHLAQLLESDPAIKAEFLKLRSAATIGCFCDEGVPCHRDVILEFLEKE